MTAFELNGIGESSSATDGMTISVTLKTADSGLVTLNMPLALSGHLIRALSASSREAHVRRRKAGQNTDFVSLIAQVKTLSVGGSERYQHPIISIETTDGVVIAYHVPTNILKRLAIGLTKLFSEASTRQSGRG
jgi:hypothetical protein